MADNLNKGENEREDDPGFLRSNPVSKPTILKSIQQDKNGESISIRREDAKEHTDDLVQPTPSQLRGFLSKESAEALQQHIQQSRDWE